MYKSKNHLQHWLHKVVYVSVIFFLLTACGISKPTAILSDISDSSKALLPFAAIPEVVIQPDDIVEIKISGSNPQTSIEINTQGGGVTGGITTGANYLVDAEGNIEMYDLGKVKIGGLKLDSAKAKIVALFTPKLKNLNVFLRFVNFKYTILGEVKSPGTFTQANNKITILEALGYSGDFLPYAKKNNVKVIRDSSGYREMGTINLTQKSIFTSPYYYLRRNDVVIVEGDISKKTQAELLAKISAGVSIISSLVTLTFLIIKK